MPDMHLDVKHIHLATNAFHVLLKHRLCICVIFINCQNTFFFQIYSDFVFEYLKVEVSNLFAKVDTFRKRPITIEAFRRRHF